MAFFHSLQFKLIGLVVALIVVSEGILSVLAYTSSAAIFEDQAASQMRSVLAFRSDALTSQLHQIEGQAASIARIETLQQAMVGLKSGWKALDKPVGAARTELQAAFVAGNPHPPAERFRLVKPETGNGYYYSVHEAMQIQAAGIIDKSPFADLMVADDKGNIVYSYLKTEAFGENMSTVEWTGSGLGKAFLATARAIADAKDDTVPAVFSGLVMNERTGQSDIYFAVPIVNLGQHRGTMIFRLRDKVIADILTKAVDAGSAERAELVTPDGSVIVAAEGRLSAVAGPSYDFARQSLSRPAAGAVMQVVDFERPDGPARSFALPVVISGETYLVSESLPLSELKAGSLRIAGILALMGVGVLLATALAAAFLLRRLLAPLGHLATLTGIVSEGQVDMAIGHQERRDEIGSMSRALERFRLSLMSQAVMREQADLSAAEVERQRLERLAEREAEARSLEGVVAALGQALNRLSEGDLASEIRTPFPAGLDALRVNFNASIRNLADTLKAIGVNSNAVRDSSDAMSGNADQLASRTEMQANSISAAAQAIDAITRSIRQQTARAEEAECKAREATDGTRASGAIMREAMGAMEAIQSSSRQINQIISVIDEIAFQTNLLALNAGVEAARAGDSGRGFAVVAQEVRELAQRSAQAAREITGLLAKSTVEVESGVGLVLKAGEALSGIEAHVAAINGQITSIKDSTFEEAENLREINETVNKLEAMTQQNAAMVEETTAAIHQLASEAGEMDNRINRFRLEADERPLLARAS
jgi:methyl-accepting chemotaxis protein